MNTPNTEITLWIEFRRLVLGLPSVVIATGAIFLVTQEHRTRADLIGDYQWAAATAMRGQDWDKADVYYRKLAWLHETDVATQYGLALVAEQQGDHDRARGLMSDIAPDDSAGFGPAHFWLARDLVRRTNRKPPAPNVLETLERHLLRTVERQPDHASAHVMLGRFYRGQGRVKRVRELFEKAAWHLAKVTPGYPKYRLELAALYRILGNAAQAESLAEASGDHFQQELDADRNDIEARLGLAAAQVFLHRFSEALGTLEDGPDPRGAEPIRKALVATWLAWVNALDPAQESLVGKRLELLQQAIQLDPENPIVLNNLAHLTMLSGPAADKARGELKDVLATGRAPAVVHLTLGSIAIKQQKLDQAEYHLNQAFEMNPRMPEVLNNLAWVVARADPPQLSRALDLADMAVKLRPRHVEMRETRGQILFQLGRHQESLEDLLIALRQLPGRTEIHVTLAAIYEQLGDDEMAERHRRRASDSKQVGGAGEAGKRPNETTE